MRVNACVCVRISRDICPSFCMFPAICQSQIERQNVMTKKETHTGTSYWVAGSGNSSGGGRRHNTTNNNNNNKPENISID